MLFLLVTAVGYSLRIAREADSSAGLIPVAGVTGYARTPMAAEGYPCLSHDHNGHRYAACEKRTQRCTVFQGSAKMYCGIE